MTAPTVYITTPIYYVNDKPHIGHAYTTTVCDVYARFQRFAGREVFFLTGTDEHGQKVEKSAREHGLPPQQWADENAAEFQRVLTLFNLTNDDFIRTTQPRHEKQVQAFVTRLIESGAVYLGKYEGWYDEGQEEYVTETKAKDVGYKSAITGKPLVRANETNYYFRLSAYQQRLEQLFAQHPGFVRPEARRNEVLGRLRDGLQDVPISRTNFTWGIPVLTSGAGGGAGGGTEGGAEQHVIYVWIDALFNYITALGLGDPGSDAFRARAKFWPATYHVIGKEILWFHAVIWPAILMALDLPLPQCVYAHSFWISEGQKMSKSLGNFIDLAAIQRYHDIYGLDAWRYYMATQGPLGATDADFSAAHFHDIYTTDLVNTVGNCASRITAMIGKYFEGVIPPHAGPDDRREEGPDRAGGGPVIADHDWPSIAADAVARSRTAIDRLELSDSIAAALGLIRRIDGFINATEPFKLAKDPKNQGQLGAILYQCTEALRIASLLLWPTMPAKMAELWGALGLAIDPAAGQLHELSRWGGLKPGTKVQKVALFPRLEKTPAATTIG